MENKIILNSNIKADIIKNKEDFWKNYITGSQIKNIIENPLKEYNIKLGIDKRLFNSIALKRMRWGTLVEPNILELAKKYYGFKEGQKLKKGEKIIVDKRTFKRLDIPFGANVDALIVKDNKIKGVIEIKNTTISDFDKLLKTYKLQILHYCYVLQVKYAWLIAKIPNDDIISIKIDYEKEKHNYEKWIPFLKDFRYAVNEKDINIIADLEYTLSGLDTNTYQEKLSGIENIEVGKLVKKLYEENEKYLESYKKIKTYKEQLKMYINDNYTSTYDDIHFKAVKINKDFIDNNTRLADICKKVNIDASDYTDEKYKTKTSYVMFKVKKDKK